MVVNMLGFPFFSGITDYYDIDISQSMIDECTNRYPEATAKFIEAELLMLLL